jgi:hypothetical protein
MKKCSKYLLISSCIFLFFNVGISQVNMIIITPPYDIESPGIDVYQPIVIAQSIDTLLLKKIISDIHPPARFRYTLKHAIKCDSLQYNNICNGICYIMPPSQTDTNKREYVFGRTIFYIVKNGQVVNKYSTKSENESKEMLSNLIELLQENGCACENFLKRLSDLRKYFPEGNG